MIEPKFHIGDIVRAYSPYKELEIFSKDKYRIKNVAGININGIVYATIIETNPCFKNIEERFLEIVEKSPDIPNEYKFNFGKFMPGDKVIINDNANIAKETNYLRGKPITISFCSAYEHSYKIKEYEESHQLDDIYWDESCFLACEPNTKELEKLDKTKDSAFRKQVGGDFYTKMPMQPVDFCMSNGLNTLQSYVIKYITRYKHKDGSKDLKKAIHCIELLIEKEYGENCE